MSIEDKSKEIVFEDNFVNIDYLEYEKAKDYKGRLHC